LVGQKPPWQVEDVDVLAGGYTRDELVSAARVRGFLEANTRRVTEYAALGLLDRPERRGRGRGKGVVSSWPTGQLELFCVLLSQRRRRAPLGGLGNAVVWLWLVWGDDYVPLRQVRRVLPTWLAAARSTTWTQAREGARETVRKIAHPHAEGKRELQRLLSEAGYRRQVDEEELLHAFRSVFDPRDSGRPRGPLGAQLTPELYAGMVRARLAGEEHLAEFDDATFERARSIYRSSRASYAQDFARLAADPELGALFERPDADEVANSACPDLVLILGYLWLESRPTPVAS